MIKYNIQDHVIVITGAAGQLGQAIVSRAISLGAKVACLDTSLENLEKISISNGWGDSVLLFQSDITNKESIELTFNQIVNKYNKIDALINNAGVSVFDPWFDRNEEDFDWVMNVNLKGTFNCMKEFFKLLIDSNYPGAVVNVASHYGIISPDPKIYTDCDRRNSEIYGATKAGVIQMTKYFAVNAIADGAKVRVNAIAPGGIKNSASPQGDDFQRLYSERCPMKRMAEVDEIVGPILFLVSSDASYINGQTIVIDGGMTAW